jgi:hypothetical protein
MKARIIIKRCGKILARKLPDLSFCILQERFFGHAFRIGQRQGNKLVLLSLGPTAIGDFFSSINSHSESQKVKILTKEEALFLLKRELNNRDYSLALSLICS